MDDFESAVSQVESGVVQSVREKPQFELPEVGSCKAKCIETKLQERNGKGGAYVVILATWELEQEYEFNGEKKKHRVFDSYGLSYGPKSKLHKTFLALTGEKPDPLVETEEFKQGGRDMIRETFPFECFVGMEAEVAIVHSEPADNGRVYANIGSYMCKDAQKKANAALCFEDDDGAKA